MGWADTGWWVGSAAVLLDCEAEEPHLFCGGTGGKTATHSHALQASSSGGSEEGCACAGCAVTEAAELGHGREMSLHVGF